MSKKHAKFLVACPKDEWKIISKSKNFINASKYVEFVHLSMSKSNKNISPVKRMGEGHVKATEYCFNNNYLGVALTPDLIVSDGVVKTIIENFKKKFDILLLPALRYEKESLFNLLENHGLIKKKNNEKELIPLNAAKLSSFAIESLHHETDYYRYENKTFFHCTMPALLFDLPLNKGFLVKCMTWLPLYINYEKIKKHDLSTIKNWSIDGDYLEKNFGSHAKVKVITKSNEAIVVSWSSKNERTFYLNQNSYLLNFFSSTLKPLFFREEARSRVFDDLKRKLLCKDVFLIYESSVLLNPQAQKVIIFANKITDLKKNIYFDKIIYFILFKFNLDIKLYISRLYVLLECIFFFKKDKCLKISKRFKKIFK